MLAHDEIWRRHRELMAALDAIGYFLRYDNVEAQTAHQELPETTDPLLGTGLYRHIVNFERYQRDMSTEAVQEYVKRWAAREGWGRRDISPTQKRGTQQTHTFAGLCYALWRNGASEAQIAAELGRSQQQVSRWVLKGRTLERKRST